MLDLNALDVDEIATALSDQTDYEYRWLIDPRTGEIAFWTSDTGIDGENPIDLDELDLLPIDPLPSHIWYADVTHFAQHVSDGVARQRLARSLSGRGAFRRFKNELYEEYLDLVSVWQAFRDAHAHRRAVGWLLDQGLIPEAAAQDFTAGHPDPGQAPATSCRTHTFPTCAISPRMTVKLGPTSSGGSSPLTPASGRARGSSRSPIVERQAIRRRVFKAVRDLNTKIRTFINGWNDRAHPFVWTKTAEQVLAKANRPTTADPRHWTIAPRPLSMSG